MPSEFRPKIYSLFCLTIFTFLSGTLAVAQEEIAYDPYATPAEEVVDSETPLFWARLLEQPFRPVGHVLGKGAEWAERHHVYEKTVWFFDTIHSHGVYPTFRQPTDGGFGLIGPGIRLRLEQLFGIEQPPASVDLTAGWTPNHGFAGSTADLGAVYTTQTPTGAFFNTGKVQYRRSSSESFFGIGRDSSLGEWSSYQTEETRLENMIGYNVTPNIDARGGVVFQHMKIGNGNRERVGKIKEVFGGAGLPGIEGGNMIGGEFKIQHDTRDNDKDPKRGGYQGMHFGYYHDTDDNDFHYLNVKGEVTQFFTLWSDRRVLALRIAAEKNQDLGDSSIPFYNLARLGGAKRGSGSELLRSYRPNRYYEEGVVVANIEYRYRVYEYGNFSGDSFIFGDFGHVFEEFGDLGFHDLRYSAGGGLDFKFRRKPLISMTVARGSEGWRVSVGKQTSF